MGLARRGQSMVEFALILPLFVLIIIGVFDLGRAFFAFISISNAAREGARVYTFSPDITTIDDITSAITTELGADPSLIPVDWHNIESIVIQCGNAYAQVNTDSQLASCPGQQPIRVTVTYTQTLILSLFFPEPLTLVRSVEMMVPWKN